MFVGEVYCTYGIYGQHFIVDCISCSSLPAMINSNHPVCQVALEPLAKLIVHAANQKAMAVAIANAANTVNTVNAAATLGDWSSDENGGTVPVGLVLDAISWYFMGISWGVNMI